MNLYVALSSRGLQGSYHWALLISEGIPTGPVPLYQIINKDTTKPDDTGDWRLDHKFDTAQTACSNPFLGCVELPGTVSISSADLDDFIRQYPAEMEDTERWTCARWIIRILRGLVDAKLLSLNMTTFYQRVIAQGMRLEAGQGTVDRASNIRVIKYE